MADTKDRRQPSPELRALLYTDFDGNPADPDDVIADALDDDGCLERAPGLTAILQDRAADPAARLLACCALTSWADPLGYETVLQAAAAPDDVVWRGQSADRFFSQDDTFGQLADAVGASRDMVDERGTAELRIVAARALLSLADRVRFDRHISSLLFHEIVEAARDEIDATVERGIDRLASGEHVPYDLGLQLALLTVAMKTYDAPRANDAMIRLATARPGERALRELADATGSSLWLM
ncbi:hypothetical protein [Streptomyces sp. NBC_00986]|uniref:hypothetical protein n=1 Tax=Streptomyces sp. NBC_00986 TaxID=2903702 RepID=UPI00386CD6D9|nr:hypothetical protein OG504_29670 [Streptomyces sp. NBC_00986]